MGSEPKEMKYRRRSRVSEPGEYGQCSDRSGAVDWGALKQDPVELLRKLDEIRDQITRSCEIMGHPQVERHRMSRRTISPRPSDAEPPPPPPGRVPEYHRSRFAGRYGHGLPPSSHDQLQVQRPVCEERYARQPSGRFRQCAEGQWENYGYGQGNCHHSTCQCTQCVHGQQPVVQEHIPMARFFAGQQRSFRFERSPSISSEYDRRSVASSLYSHLSMSKRRVEYFRKKAENFCRPMKGAAPFVVCSSCNQLLQLPPGKCAVRKQNQFQCGSCSELITFKLKEVKVHPVIPPSFFQVPKSVRSSNRRVPQSSGWYQHQDDDNSSFNKLQAHDSQRQNKDFADNISLSSNGSYESTNKEHGSKKSIQLKSVYASRSRFADRPKDILCQGDADSQVEASALCKMSPQAPILEDKLVDPFSRQQKNCSGGDQITSKKYGLNSKADYGANVKCERIDLKCEQKSKEAHEDGFGEVTLDRTYEQKHKIGNAGYHEDRSMGNKYKQMAKNDDSTSLEDECMSKKYEEKCKEDDNSFKSQGVDKRDKKCGKEDHSNAIEAGSITKGCEEENIENDDGESLFSSCKNANTADNNEPLINEQTYTISRVSSEGDEIQSSARKSGDSSFFAGFLKKGFKDLSLFNQHVDSVKISINGHAISERALRKAEKKAGPIGPGSYWYDHRAGFWGVMGHECSGIIPPSIKEFNYSMPKNCAGGNTGVFVNGRELHNKDFDLLVKRGLPRISGKSYSVDISGNVVDETSGKKLRNLGKLAPTIEKMKRGFGMHTPEEIS